MKIVTYCNIKYKDCLDKFVDTWPQPVEVYTDGDFGIKFFEEKDLTFQQECERKILTIQEALRRTDDDILYLDADCMVTGEIDVFSQFPNHNILVTRGIRRKDRPRMEDSINAGVIFIRNNGYSLKFIREWHALTVSLRGDKKLGRLHEQNALDQLVLREFDRGRGVAYLSERVYNLEDDSKTRFVKLIRQYKPRIVHFKNQWWRDDNLIKQVDGLYKRTI
jgi:lipopolysaccharide biosynthesis glycosyltransferase